jgi:hypothetical protein
MRRGATGLTGLTGVTGPAMGGVRGDAGAAEEGCGVGGVMPVDFAVSDGITHIVAGTLALMTAWGLAHRRPPRRI